MPDLPGLPTDLDILTGSRYHADLHNAANAQLASIAAAHRDTGWRTSAADGVTIVFRRIEGIGVWFKALGGTSAAAGLVPASVRPPQVHGYLHVSEGTPAVAVVGADGSFDSGGSEIIGTAVTTFYPCDATFSLTPGTAYP